MKHASLFLCMILASLLSACALTPEERAAQEAARKRAQQELQIQLAAQCNPETANLMRQQFSETEPANETEKQDFRLRYIEQINDPMFQACYKMAWQNHIAQQQLKQMERAYFWYEHNLFWHRPMMHPLMMLPPPPPRRH